MYAICFLKYNRSTCDVIPNVWSKDHLHENPIVYQELLAPPMSPCVKDPVSYLWFKNMLFHRLITRFLQRKSSSADLISFSQVSVLACNFQGWFSFLVACHYQWGPCLPMFQCTHWCAELGGGWRGCLGVTGRGGEGCGERQGKRTCFMESDSAGKRVGHPLGGVDQLSWEQEEVGFMQQAEVTGDS